MRTHRLPASFFLTLILSCSWAWAGSYEDFFDAVKRDNPKTIQQLLESGFDPNTVNAQGRSGLQLAIKEPSFRVANVMIASPETDLNYLTPEGESALMLAALEGYADLSEKLIAQGADVNKPGWTPLHYAATRGHVLLIKILLDNHAYIDAESPNGTTPLMMAAHYGTAAAVKALLEGEADPLMKNEQGLSAIDFAQRADRADIVELIAKTIRNKQPAGEW